MDKMREEFEAWAKLKGYPLAFSSVCESYWTKATEQCWQAWQASRKALVVELPTTWNASFTEKAIVMDADSVVEALDAAGVAYK